ncbi:MAG: Lrp/AsnC family transcriptional regulator [Candidatus Marinimicrobia bacterium]|jgi:Lrp/AsnC family leucine-responsive transcriptional regulator|nr:Lrp/AsnC family transcriptional regulator [Candidatus Neomarinimicrobiota bacterium]MDP6853117.1 Lrp/AsnC family transcriptional regulator [Candidatus Neomarinimicrobiota bacterium]MDP6936481.1 Lrp/AsnC family transcriptional regulator [Candidatus Neomarinimicrobiota bacterium]
MAIITEISNSETIKLDHIDKEILHLLQIDGRSSASYIAESVGMSIPAVTDRIKKLQESGIIMGFTTILDHRKVGMDVSAFITVISESSSHYSDVVRETNNTPEIIQCYTTTGNGSHVLLALTENTHSLERLLRTIQSWPGVRRTETQIILSSYKGINSIQIPE